MWVKIFSHNNLHEDSILNNLSSEFGELLISYSINL
jgi:hypothetical protein